MPEIKIFVSHRIDINSELIDNPLYVPVRCGAVFDQENPMGIIGDDTGENISRRRMSFNELTVQYWAWKNVQTDYYGLCHYRRYLSFSDKRFMTDEYTMVHVPALLPCWEKKYGLLDQQRMKALIGQYDVVTSEYADVGRIPTPAGRQTTVYDLWNSQSGIFFEPGSIELLFSLIDNMAPEYSDSAREYFSGNKHRGFNCYVMRQELFDRLCRLQFPILFEVERRLDTSGYTETLLRTPGFLGEMLYGIFLYHISSREHWNIKELQLVFFQNTEKLNGPVDAACRYLWTYTDRALRAVIDPFFPKGTKRREKLKDLFYSITPAKRRGMAAPQQIKDEKRN